MLKILITIFVASMFLSKAQADELTMKSRYFDKTPDVSNMERSFYRDGHEVAKEVTKSGVVIKSEGKIPDGVFKEESEEYIREIRYMNGKPVGGKVYTKDGKLKAEDEFKDGNRLSRMYYPNGKLRSEAINNKDNTRITKDYDVNGKLEYETFSDLNKGYGYSFKTYNSNGKLKEEGVADASGNLQYEKIYDLNGNVLKEFGLKDH